MWTYPTGRSRADVDVPDRPLPAIESALTPFMLVNVMF
jgi:hypothetical protein